MSDEYPDLDNPQEYAEWLRRKVTDENTTPEEFKMLAQNASVAVTAFVEAGGLIEYTDEEQRLLSEFAVAEEALREALVSWIASESLDELKLQRLVKFKVAVGRLYERRILELQAAVGRTVLEAGRAKEQYRLWKEDHERTTNAMFQRLSEAAKIGSSFVEAADDPNKFGPE